jgi:hypothetical protein
MKKKTITILLVLLALLLCFADNLFSQPYLGLGVSNKGILTQVGVLADKIEIIGTWKLPFSQNDVATILGLQVGTGFALGHKEKDNFFITPAVGFANYRIKDFADYNADPTGRTGIVQISEFRSFLSIELDKDMARGRLFISANYCKDAYFGFGIKIFPYRN